jgi:hypothetical protein
LRLTQNPSANLELLPDDVRDSALTGGDAIVARACDAAR